MTNVVPFQSRGSGIARGEAAMARNTAALVADLVAVAEQIRTASEAASHLPYPSLRIERTVQSLLDAITAVERAAAALTNDGEHLPF
jgi:hypothetical protein